MYIYVFFTSYVQSKQVNREQTGGTSSTSGNW